MNEQFRYDIKIPKERVAVLIGKNGEVKKELEETTKTKISVDSREGDVTIEGKEALGLFIAREIVLAISRGFNPDIAFQLLKGDNVIEVINLADFVGNSKADALRLKGRVIGSEGKSRRIIEELTDTNVCVYGKTVAIIGQPNNALAARKAIESLLSGSRHASVYRWLEKKRRELKQGEVEEASISSITPI